MVIVAVGVVLGLLVGGFTKYVLIMLAITLGVRFVVVVMRRRT